MLIPVYNPETTDYEKTYLSDGSSIGATTIYVRNADRIAANDRIMIGEMGQEKTEIVTVSAVDSGKLSATIGATKFSHSADDPVTVMQFDQVRYYKSTTGSTGTYSLITTVDLDVDNAELQTIYDDTTGTASTYYKVSMYHSIDLIESAFSDPIQGSGFDRRQVGAIVDQILQEVGDTREVNVTRNELLGYFNDVNDDLTINVSKPYDFLHARTTLNRTANTNYIDFPTDSLDNQTMWKFDRMDYNYTDSTTTPTTDKTYTLVVIPPEEFRNKYQDNTIDSTTVSDVTKEMCLDTSVNRFRFYPPFETSGSSVFYLHYWKYFDEITSEADFIETPTPKIYKLYCKGMYYRKRGVTEPSFNNIADRYFADYAVEKAKYKGVDRKDKGTPRSFRPVDSTITGFRR